MGPSIKPKSLSSIIHVPPILYMFLFRANFPLVSCLCVRFFLWHVSFFFPKAGGGKGGREVGGSGGWGINGSVHVTRVGIPIPLIYYTMYTQIYQTNFSTCLERKRNKKTCKASVRVSYWS